MIKIKTHINGSEKSYRIRKFPVYIGSNNNKDTIRIPSVNFAQRKYRISIRDQSLIIEKKHQRKYKILKSLNLNERKRIKLHSGDFDIHLETEGGYKKNIVYDPDELPIELIGNELNKWNWGAFFLPWIWGLGNRTYIALLSLIPFVGIIMAFILGIKGNEWAWQNGHWRNYEHFREAQRKWAIGGISVFAFSFFVIFITFFIAIGVGSQVYSDSSKDASRSAIVSDMTNLASMAQQYYRKPTALGGGAQSFYGWEIPFSLSKTANGRYTAIVRNQSILLLGHGNETGDDGLTPINVEMIILPNEIESTEINN